jgi:hypothetical protein
LAPQHGDGHVRPNLDRWTVLCSTTLLEDARVNDDDFAELFKSLNSGPSTGTSWQDVADELAALGRTLGDVLRRAWQQSDDDQTLARLREVLQAMADDLNRAVDGTPEATYARDQLTQLTDRLRAAAERAGDELRPELLSLLRQANAELRRRSHLDQ